MKIKAMITCLECGQIDYDKPGYVGTSTLMTCPDCNKGKMNKYNQPLAQLCRKCCPTWHQTKCD